MTGAVVVAGAVQLALDRADAVWRSTDGGARWERVLPRPRARDQDRAWHDLPPTAVPEDDAPAWAPDDAVAIARGELEGVAPRLWCEPAACWVVRSDGAYRSTDGGQSWTAEARPPRAPVAAHPWRLRRWARSLPAVTVDAVAVDVASDGWLAAGGWAPVSARRAGWAEVHLTLGFAPPGRRSAAGAAPGSVDVVEVGGRRFVVDPQVDPAFAQAVLRALAEAEVAREAQLAEWRARRAALPAPAGGTLLDRALAALDRAELDAQIAYRVGEGR